MTGLSDDVWAISHNPAGWTQVTGREFGCSYSPQLFDLSELSDANVVGVLNTTFGTIGISMHRFGYSLYRELTGTLGYARMFDNVSVGIAANIYTVSIERYGSASTLGVDVGLHVRLLDALRWGVVVRNINAPVIGTARAKLPQEYVVGVAFVPNAQTRLTFDVQKETASEPSPRFGFEYWPVEPVAFRAGFSDEPSEVAGGLGIRYSAVQFDYAIVHHQELGWTHVGSVSLRFGGSDE